ncbi:septation protein SepH [Microbacterium sp. NIBRBAC000506063]|uniref:septation protein SepH n=1 Tax=Microbacterium sp. NIBRBAC000506063 TaxID=2734618 RepID=UPI00397F4B9D
MENVTIVGTEDNVLVLATESGTRFALPIDEVLRREMRRAQARTSDAVSAVSPREIQAHIRSGLTSAEVSELLGISLEDVIRFEGPVVAEREHIIGQALAVPVLLGSEVEPAAQPTFGAAIRAKLASLEATDERWVSWKDERGWTVKLEFTASDVAHDARWSFEPRSSTLAPSTPTPPSSRARAPSPTGSSRDCAHSTPSAPRRTRTTLVSTPGRSDRVRSSIPRPTPMRHPCRSGRTPPCRRPR